MDKQTLRAAMRAQKRALTAAQIDDCSARLARRLQAHPAYRNARSLYGYLSYNQEVRTRPLLAQAQRDGKRVAVPKVFGAEMRFLWLDDLAAVSPGYAGIPEPLAGGPEADDPAALVLLPGLAFDPAGRRCGYGGGFYDKWLAAHPGHPLGALCYGFQLLDRLETDPHDVPVDFVLAEPIL
ncbi:MAG: 5-formyltetrahydrofolate cyclo-ligase [Oscillospiraceae bacterium]|nr:5-formyltetrahydrofolate cyclo-ligase [Oscillospiraceae bacterium]